MTADSRARLTLAPQTASAGLARRWLAEQLADSEVDLAETALLLTSEIVTNAVLHARTPIDVAVQVAPGRVRIEVADRSPVLPVTKHYHTSAETGRGLVLLEALASDWGVEAAPGGKVVWFDIAGPRAGGDVGADPGLTETTRSPLDGWPELADAPTPDRPMDGALVDIQILRLPVPVLRRAAEHSDALLREFRLILERRPGEGRAIPGQLLTLVDELAGRYSGFNAGADADLQLAYERGAAWIDLSYRLPADVGSAAARLDLLFDEADEYCRAGADLLTLSAPPDAVAVRKWFLQEFSRQAAGEPAQAWPASPWFLPGAATGELQVEEMHRGQSVILELLGDLDVHTAPALRDRLVGLVTAGQSDLVVDVTGLSFIDSTGIGVLIGGMKRCRAQGGDLELRAVNEEILAVFRVTGLDELFVMAPPEPA